MVLLNLMFCGQRSTQLKHPKVSYNARLDSGCRGFIAKRTAELIIYTFSVSNIKVPEVTLGFRLHVAFPKIGIPWFPV